MIILYKSYVAELGFDPWIYCQALLTALSSTAKIGKTLIFLGQIKGIFSIFYIKTLQKVEIKKKVIKYLQTDSEYKLHQAGRNLRKKYHQFVVC